MLNKPCQNCSKLYFCKNKNCKFVSWKNTKNYGEVKEEKQKTNGK